MVDAERLGLLLARVREDVERIRGIDAVHDLVHDPVALDAVGYGFVTSIEGWVLSARVRTTERRCGPRGSAATIAAGSTTTTASNSGPVASAPATASPADPSGRAAARRPRCAAADLVLQREVGDRPARLDGGAGRPSRSRVP